MHLMPRGSRREPTLSDYGSHIDSEAEWESYGTCPRCFAETGKPCRNLSYVRTVAPPTWKPHEGRPVRAD